MESDTPAPDYWGLFDYWRRQRHEQSLPRKFSNAKAETHLELEINAFRALTIETELVTAVLQTWRCLEERHAAMNEDHDGVNHFAQEEQSRWQLKKGPAHNIYLKIGNRVKTDREDIV